MRSTSLIGDTDHPAGIEQYLGMRPFFAVPVTASALPVSLPWGSTEVLLLSARDAVTNVRGQNTSMCSKGGGGGWDGASGHIGRE